MPRQGCGKTGRVVHALAVWSTLWSTLWATPDSTNCVNFCKFREIYDHISIDFYLISGYNVSEAVMLPV